MRENKWSCDGNNLYTIKKKIEGRYKFYQVINDKGEVVEEFDDYNYQKPFKQAKEFIKNLI